MAINANNPPTIVKAVGFSLRKIQHEVTAVKGTMNVKELVLLEPIFLEA